LRRASAAATPAARVLCLARLDQANHDKPGAERFEELPAVQPETISGGANSS
jgi:hypothetical protein